MIMRFREKKGLMMTVVLCVMVLLCCLGIATAAEYRQPLKIQPRSLTLEMAKQEVITKLYKGQIGSRALYANPVLKKPGALISSWQEPNMIRISKESWFFFVDEQPGANWEHKASYILVDKTTRAVKSIPAMSPPKEMMELKPLNTRAISEMQMLKQNIKLVNPQIVTDIPIEIIKKEKYAVLLSGGMNSTYNYARYWNDLKFIYKALKEKYGYTDSGIIVLYANGTHVPNGDLDGNGTNDIDYAANKANLTKVLNKVAARIANNGTFFFYSTNHGGDDSGAYKSNLTLWGESIKDSDFAVLTKNIKCAKAIYVMEQCFSGGMMDDLLKAQTYPCTNPKVCIMTAARHDEPSWSCDTEGEYDEYVYHWTSAVYGKNPGGTPVNADTNHDGKVSMSEAHTYAMNHDSRGEHPQIGSCVTGASNTTL
jgi:hypothetical protein